MVLLPGLCLLFPSLLLPGELYLKHTGAWGNFGLEPIVVLVKVERPSRRKLFDGTPAFPALKSEASVLPCAVEGAGEVGLSIKPDTILYFISVLVDVDPVHDRCGIGNGSHEALVIRVWIGQVVASIRMAKRVIIACASIDP